MRLLKRGVTEYPTFFKLIASGEKFDARLWQQEGLEKAGREIIVVQPEVWVTKEITIQCVVPEQDADRSPVVTERPIVDTDVFETIACGNGAASSYRQ